MNDRISPSADQLVALLASYESCLVAYSGGVDSAVVAQAACLALGERALAVTGVSGSLAAGELDAAQRVAAAIGVRHETIATDELSDPAYQRNAPDRCFHCKTELYSQLTRLAEERGFAVVASGANSDDLGDFRPGLQAAAQHRIRSPLAECGLDKVAVRSLAKHWGIEAWDKPATPCLSSRIAYGVGVSPERLARIDAAEQLLRSHGLGSIRVRLHENDLARLEVPLAELPRLCEPAVREPIVRQLRDLGFRYVTLDLEGFRSGSFQQLVPVEVLAQFASTPGT